MLEFLLDVDALAAMLALHLPGRPRLVGREPNPYGDGRSEIVSWQLPDGQEIKLFCKYDDLSPTSDVAYEARVYREVLEPLGLSTLRYYGSDVDEESGHRWLLLEYVEGADDRDRGLRDEDAMVLAAGWLGAFHAACERRFAPPPSFLHRFDAPYYHGLARRVLAEAGSRDSGWLAPICDRIGLLLEPLMATRSTIVHADYYDDNMLIHEGRVRPLDWEMAAVDLGESDLAFLVGGWDEDVEAACVAAYRESRWPEGAPEDFDVVLTWAKLCLRLHKLAVENGLRPDERRRQLTRLHDLAAALGLLDGAVP